MPTGFFMRNITFLSAVLFLLLAGNSPSAVYGQSLEFEELLDNAMLDRDHLSGRLQVDFVVAYTRSGLGKVAVDGKAVDREVFDNVQEYGRLVRDEGESLKVVHFHRRSINVRKKPDSDNEDVKEGELAFHTLVNGESGWYGLGASSYTHRGEVRSESVPRSLGEFPFEILPYCDITVLKTHGIRKARAVDFVSSATVISDETKDGNRELTLLYPNRMGGMRVTLERWNDWRPLTVECFIGSPTNRIYPRDEGAAEAFDSKWKMYSRLSVDWGHKVVQGERKVVPLHLVAVSPSLDGRAAQTMEATFCNWKFESEIPDSAFTLRGFEEQGKNGIDFLSIKNEIIASRRARKESEL